MFRLNLKGRRFRQAGFVASDDPNTLANAAFALAAFGEDIDVMIALADRALELNPNFAQGWFISGVLRAWAGLSDYAIGHVEASLRLSPRVRTALVAIGLAYFLSRRFDQAVPRLLLAIQEDPSLPVPYRYLAARYAHMGRLDDAREIVERLRAVTPVVIPDISFLRNPEHRELLLSGLRLGGRGGRMSQTRCFARSPPPIWRLSSAANPRTAVLFGEIEKLALDPGE